MFKQGTACCLVVHNSVEKITYSVVEVQELAMSGR